MVFEPFVATHELDDPVLTATTLGYLHAFGTELAVIMSEPDSRGLLDHAVEELGKIFLTTEISGGRGVSRRSVDVAYRGVTNTLRHAGIIPGDPDVDRAPRLVRMVDDPTILAPFDGLYEPIVEVGQRVRAGALLARVHPLDDLSTSPVEVGASVDGMVIMRHVAGLIAVGDPVAALATPTDDGGAGSSPEP